MSHMGTNISMSSAALLALAFMAVCLLARYKSARSLTAFAVGATGSLVDAQFFGIHLFTMAVVVWASTTRPSRDRAPLHRAFLLMVFAGMLASTSMFGDLVNSASLGLQLVALTFCAAVILRRSDSHDQLIMMRGLFACVTVGSGVALLQFTQVIPATLLHRDISTLGRPIGIWPEPDWLGLFAAVGLVLAWRMASPAKFRGMFITINGLALILAFGRAAWLALAVSVALLTLLRLFQQPKTAPRSRGRIQAVLALGLVAIIPLGMSPTLRSDLYQRVTSTVSSSNRDVSANARLEQMNGLLYLAESAAPLGHGLSASGRVGVSGRLNLGSKSPNNVGSNWLLSMWVDGALLALPLMLLLGSTALRRASSIGGQLLVIVLLSSLFSNATFFPIAWLCLGLSLAGRRKPIAPWGAQASTIVQMCPGRDAAVDRCRESSIPAIRTFSPEHLEADLAGRGAHPPD